MTTSSLRSEEEMNGKYKKLGLYIHVPFCVSKCKYCDFLSFAGKKEDVVSEYFNHLRRELRYCDNILGDEYKVDTIFIGGGTPSCVESKEISMLMETLNDCRIFEESNNAYQVSGNENNGMNTDWETNTNIKRNAKTEITIEANPGTVDFGKLYEYRKSGINRISFGVQSFNDEILANLGRIHTSGDAVRNYEEALRAGFTNVNLDLMFGVPSHSMKIWKETLRTVTELDPMHISFYSLQIEEGTPLYEAFRSGIIDEISDDLNRAMYHYAVDTLIQAGYNHYEISNASKRDMECKHNLKYWSMQEYLGIGLGAHSFLNGKRFSNTKDLKTYIEDDESFRWNSLQLNAHINSLDDDLEEFMFTGLRNVKGINTLKFEEAFKCSIYDIYKKELEKLVGEGLIIKEEDESGKYEQIRLSDRGIDISNSVLCEFIRTV